MFLQNPLALIALLGLLVPLLIHLWERRQGRRVPVGSIRWLEAAEERQVSRLRFTDRWRWLLRSLIVVLFVLLLAGAGWRSSEPAPVTRHWVLVEPLPMEGELDGVLDSLRGAGRNVRWLAAGFPDWERDAPPPPYDTTADYWSYLREIAMQDGRPDTVTVLARPRLRHFRGEQPRLPFFLQWRSLPEEEAQLFLAAGWRVEDQIRLLLGESSAQGLTFQAVEVPAMAGRHALPTPYPPLDLESDGRPGSWQARLGGDARTVPVKPLPRRVVRLYYDRERNDEQRSILAALRAAAAYTGWRIESSRLPVAEAEVPETPPGPEEWVFWLSEAPPPPAIAAAYAPRLLRYAIASYPEAPGRYIQPDNDSYLLRHVPGTGEAGPATDDRLPAELIGLLFAEAVQLPTGIDQRSLDEQQLQPTFQAASFRRSTGEAKRQLLHLPLWLVLCGLFLLERLTAARQE